MSHVAHQDFQQFRKSTMLVCTLLNVAVLVAKYSSHGLVDETKLLYGCLAWSILCNFNFSRRKLMLI